MAEFLSLMEDWKGFSPVGASRYSEAQLTEALRLIRNERSMSRYAHQHALHEAITTSDFPTLFGVLVQNDMLAKYKITVAEWRAYCATGTLPNFNIHTKHKVYGQDDLLPQVAEKGPYLAEESGTGHYHGQLAKYGRMFDISWESVINDSMGAFRDIADRFANAVIRTEARHVTELFAAATGPNPLLFGAPIADVDGQNVTNLGVLPLTPTNISATLALMAAQTDPNGEPISVRGVHLVVPLTLEDTALAATQSQFVQQIAGAVALPTMNIVAKKGIQVHPDPFLQVVDATATDDTTWYMFAEPGQGKAMEMDFLTGAEQPELCMKASDKVSMGGGLISPFDGDFDSDDIRYRVRCVHGGWRLDPRYCYAHQAP
jgi:hypothetical protein